MTHTFSIKKHILIVHFEQEIEMDFLICSFWTDARIHFTGKDPESEFGITNLTYLCLL